MITRIEISGFKTFTDFAVELAPFTVIAGANASGKSNLLDALQILSDLMVAQDAFPDFRFRGGLNEAFTKYQGKNRTDSMRFAVELLLPKTVTLDGKEHTLKYNRFRYEVAIREIAYEEGEKALLIDDEKLTTILTDQDTWIVKYIDASVRDLYVIEQHNVPVTIIENDHFYHDYGLDGTMGMLSSRRTFQSQAVLSESFINSDIHARMVRQEIQSLRKLDTQDSANFSNYGATYSNYDKSNYIISELIKGKKDPDSLSIVSNRIREIIPDVKSINVYTDPFQRTTITATDTLNREFIATNLSEGTLRVLALSTLLLRQAGSDIILLEEPENGVDPRVLDRLLSLLLDLTSDLESDRSDLRQIICTTHSPTLLQEALKRQKDRHTIRVLLATKVTALVTINGQRRKLPTTRMNEVVTTARTDNEAEPLTRYTLSQALDYLNRLQLPNSLQKAAPDA